jgi:hypothetical protein
MRQRSRLQLAACLDALLVLALGCTGRSVALVPTVGEVERVRAGITVQEGPRTRGVDDVLRIGSGAEVRTDASGRAVLGLDHGERLLLDHDSRVHVGDDGAVTLDEGRVWIERGARGSRGGGAVLRAGVTTLRLDGARASVRRDGDGAEVDVLEGEVTWARRDRQGVVRTGEHGALRGEQASVGPRRLFSDWTGGLADSAARGVSTTGATELGAVSARRPDDLGRPRWPLVLQRVEARVSVVGDLAVTELEQTFFNPSADVVEGLYTLTVPRGAVLQRFAVERRGNLVDATVQERASAAAQYQAQVYAGSPFDPALLEWDAPGRYHARLFPVAAGSARRILVTYTQWLNPTQDGRRSYRLPLSGIGASVGELRAEVDLSRTAIREVRATSGTVVDGTSLTFRRSDVTPTADFVLDLLGAPAAEGSVLRSPGDTEGNDRGSYVRVALQAPDRGARSAHDDGVDVVVVADHSAATGAEAAALQVAFVDALTSSLTPRDRVLVLAGDVGVRPQGKANARLDAASGDARTAALDALSRDRLGGATDLLAMVEAAHAALDPERNGAIVYLGDGRGTVGERELSELRTRLGRMQPRPRFYAVAMGEGPRLDLLAGIAAPSGLAARVVDRGEVARTAMTLLSHMARPLVRGFRAELGPEVERVYPTEPVDLPAGEALEVLGRVVGRSPERVTVRARWHGAERTGAVTLSGLVIPDRGDLRARWASARLEHLLARDEPRAAIVELGTRYGLITPFTSLFVPGEDAYAAPPPVSDVRDFSVFDMLPLVGCSRSQDAPPEVRAASVEAPAPPQSAPAMPSTVAVTTPTTGATHAAPGGQPADIDRSRAAPSRAHRPTAAAAAERGMDDALGNQVGAMGGGGFAAPAPVAPPAVAAAPTPEAAPAPPADEPTAGIAPASGRMRRRSDGPIQHGQRQREVNTGADEESTESAAAAEPQPDPTSALTGALGARQVERERDRGGDGLREPRGPAAGPARCSDAAAVTLAERVPLWRERIGAAGGVGGALGVLREARRSCELPGWSDEVALLRLIAAAHGSVDDSIALARGAQGGAKRWFQQQAMRAMARAGDLSRVGELGLGRLDPAELTRMLTTTADPAARRVLLQSLARRFPEDLDLMLLTLDAASAAGDADEVHRTAQRLRSDPRADARVRTAVGEALLAVRDEPEARRAFSEIVEFAPDDPFARQRLGDIALSHGWADEAYRQFQTLATSQSDAPEILLRVAWAARMLGRLDEAIRLAERITAESAPGARAPIIEAVVAWVACELAIASSEPATSAATVAQLRARWRRSPAAQGAGAVRAALRWTHPDDGAELWVTLPGAPTQRADVVASAIPLEALTLAERPTALSLEVRRGGGARPRGTAELVVLWAEGTAEERVLRTTVTLDPEHPRRVFDVTPQAITERPALEGGAR